MQVTREVQELPNHRRRLLLDGERHGTIQTGDRVLIDQRCQPVSDHGCRGSSP